MRVFRYCIRHERFSGTVRRYFTKRRRRAKIRRERLDDMPFAQKDFGPANPASVAWMDRLLTAAEAQTDAAFKREALTALCRTAYRAAAKRAAEPAKADAPK